MSSCIISDGPIFSAVRKDGGEKNTKGDVSPLESPYRDRRNTVSLLLGSGMQDFSMR